MTAFWRAAFCVNPTQTTGHLTCNCPSNSTHNGLSRGANAMTQPHHHILYQALQKKTSSRAQKDRTPWKLSNFDKKNLTFDRVSGWGTSPSCLQLRPGRTHKLLLIVQKSGQKKPVEVGVVNIPLFTGFYTSKRWFSRRISEPSIVSPHTLEVARLKAMPPVPPLVMSSPHGLGTPLGKPRFWNRESECKRRIIWGNPALNYMEGRWIIIGKWR